MVFHKYYLTNDEDKEDNGINVKPNIQFNNCIITNIIDKYLKLLLYFDKNRK